MKKKMFLFVNVDKDIINRAKKIIKDSNIYIVAANKKDDIFSNLFNNYLDAIFFEYKKSYFDFFNILKIVEMENIVDKKKIFTFFKSLDDIYSLSRLSKEGIKNIYPIDLFDKTFSEFCDNKGLK